MIRKILNKIYPVSEGVRKIGQQMIDNPMEWVQGMYEFTNKKNQDIKIWTCSGVRFLKINGFSGLTYYEKVYINNCVKMSIANRLMETSKDNRSNTEYSDTL